MRCPDCGLQMQQDTDSQGLMQWFCVDIDCNPGAKFTSVIFSPLGPSGNKQNANAVTHGHSGVPAKS